MSRDELATKLRNIEKTQLKMLKKLERLNLEEVPRNKSGIFKIGRSRTILFLNDLLPQIYLTLVSVLQGVALAVLIDQFEVEFWDSSPVLYGYFIGSFLIIVAFWHSYLSSILDGRWPFHFIDTLLFFLAAMAEGLGIRHISTPAYWCLFIGLMCLIVSLIYYRQVPLLRQLVHAEIFEDPSEAGPRIRGCQRLGLLFLLMAGIAFIFLPITVANPQNVIAPLIAIAAPIAYIFYARGRTGFQIDVIGEQT
jgi:hypothetical protein